MAPPQFRSNILHDRQGLWARYVACSRLCVRLHALIEKQGSPVRSLDGSGSSFSFIIWKICCSSEAEALVPPNRP